MAEKEHVHGMQRAAPPPPPPPRRGGGGGGGGGGGFTMDVWGIGKTPKKAAQVVWSSLWVRVLVRTVHPPLYPIPMRRG